MISQSTIDEVRAVSEAQHEEYQKSQLQEEWFYCSTQKYLTIPLSALKDMPLEWQQKFTELLKQLPK